MYRHTHTTHTHSTYTYTLYIHTHKQRHCLEHLTKNSAGYNNGKNWFGTLNFEHGASSPDG